MITVDDARALMDNKLYDEKVKEYEQTIENEIIQAAKNNQFDIYISFKYANNPLVEKALTDVMESFRDNGFEANYTCADFAKYIVYVSWQ